MNELLSFLAPLVADPLVSAATAALVSAVLAPVLGLLIARMAGLRFVVQRAADYSEAAEATVKAYKEAAVKAAEVFGVRTARKGIEKVAYAFDVFQELCKRNGIVGDAANVSYEAFKRDVDGIVARLYPKRA